MANGFCSVVELGCEEVNGFGAPAKGLGIEGELVPPTPFICGEPTIDPENGFFEIVDFESSAVLSAFPPASGGLANLTCFRVDPR